VTPEGHFILKMGVTTTTKKEFEKPEQLAEFAGRTV